MKKAIIFAVIIAVAGLLIASLIITFKKEEYPRPTNEYYIADFAGVLLPGSKYTILNEGERLYETTKDTDLGGAQVVVATMLVENQSDADEIDRTELYRLWQIGENDMGLLILLIFTQEGDEKSLLSAQVGIGYRMESYVTAVRAGYLIDNCLNNPEWEGSLDMGLGEMYYEFLSTIYTSAYGYESFDYDMEVYREFLYEYDDYSLDATKQMGVYNYIFSPYSTGWAKFFALVPYIIIVLLGGSGGLLAMNKGAGGRSGGYGVRRG